MRIKNLIAETGSISQLIGSIESASYAATALSASYAPGSPSISASFATTASYATNIPTVNFSTGSYTGSFTGSLLGSASFATTASYATVAQNVLGSITSASYALTASYAQSGYRTQDSITGQFAYYSGSALSGSNLVAISGGLLTLDRDIQINSIPYRFPSGSVARGVLQFVTGSSSAPETTSSRTAWTNNSSTNGGTFGSSIDSAAGTRWDTNAVQSLGHVYSVNFGSAINIKKYIMDTTNSAGDSPLIYSISSSLDNVSWTIIGNRSGSTVDINEFTSSVSAQYLRFGMVQGRGGAFWSIHEFNVILAAVDASVADVIWNTTVPTASVATSASFATTSSAATSITFVPASSSYANTALSASYAPGNPSISASYATTSSYATLAQNVLGSITSASYALTASYALNGGGVSSTLSGSLSARQKSYIDDYFTGSTLSSKWKDYNIGASTKQVYNGALWVKIPANSGNNVRGIIQPIDDPSGSWVYSTNVNLYISDNNTRLAGLMLYESSSGKFAIIAPARATAPAYVHGALYYTNATTFQTWFASESIEALQMVTNTTYLEVSKSANIIYYKIGNSPDGVYTLASRSVTDWFTGGPTYVGLTTNTTNASFGCTSSFSYFISGSTPGTVKTDNVLSSITSASYATTASYASNVGTTSTTTGPDAVPASPSAYDDEFTTSTLNPKWILRADASSSAQSVKYNKFGTWFSYFHSGSVIGQSGIHITQPATFSIDDAIYTKMSVDGTQNYHGVFVVVLDNISKFASGSGFRFGYEYRNTETRFYVDTVTSGSISYAVLTFDNSSKTSGPQYIRTKRIGASSVEFMISSDGVSYEYAGLVTIPNFVATDVGLTLTNGGATQAVQCGIDWIRWNWSEGM